MGLGGGSRRQWLKKTSMFPGTFVVVEIKLCKTPRPLQSAEPKAQAGNISLKNQDGPMAREHGGGGGGGGGQEKKVNI